MIQIIGSLLLLYSWIVAAILVFFLFLIGRFYELKFRKRSKYQLLLIPLVLLLAAAVWYAVWAFSKSSSPPGDFIGVEGADVLFVLGGLSLTGLCFSLYRIMTARKG